MNQRPHGVIDRRIVSKLKPQPEPRPYRCHHGCKNVTFRTLKGQEGHYRRFHYARYGETADLRDIWEKSRIDIESATQKRTKAK